VSRADVALTMLAPLREWRDGSRLDDLEHSLQTATRAQRAGADEQLVAAALLHDCGKSLSSRHHGRVASELLTGVVRRDVLWVVRVHQDFTARDLPNGRWRNARPLHRWHPAYATAARFVDEWDLPARDPAYPTEPLEHFEPLVRDLFARATDPPNAIGVTRTLRRALDALPEPAARVVGRITRAPRQWLRARRSR